MSNDKWNTDTLPPMEHDVLVTTNEGDVTRAYRTLVAEETDVWVVIYEIGGMYEDTVRAWRELPAPYEEEEER